MSQTLTPIKHFHRAWRATTRVTTRAFVFFGLMLFAGHNAAADNEYLVLCYHSVPERYNGDPMAISAPNFAEQLSWLRAQGYTAISIDDVLNAKAGKKKLPAKSFMITVDDGYEDFYTNLFPLLKLYRVPAVFAVVGKWTELGVPVANESDPHFKKQRFASWAQIKAMVQSGLVEIASHSYDLHHGIVANPQGNTQPAAVSLQYRPALKQYETPTQRRARVRADLETNSALIARHTGKRPRVMVWPYGAFDNVGMEEAARLGMPINFTLDDGLARASETQAVPRALAQKEMPLSAFTYLVEYAHRPHKIGPLRAIRVNLDRIYDPDAEKENQKLGELIERVRELGLNAVVLQPYVTPKAGEWIEQVYFPNSVLPMRADLVNRVGWQLRSRLGVELYVAVTISRYAVREQGQLQRLDIADQGDRKRILKLYEDLSAHIPLRGLVFAQSAMAGEELDFEQAVLERLSYYRPPTQPLYVGRVVTDADARAWASESPAFKRRYPLAVIDAPLDYRPEQIKKFVAKLPPQQIAVLSLPSGNLNRARAGLLTQKIAAFQRHGLNSFLLDDDRFLDDRAVVESLRLGVSLKRNPYIHVGQ